MNNNPTHQSLEQIIKKLEKTLHNIREKRHISIRQKTTLLLNAINRSQIDLSGPSVNDTGSKRQTTQLKLIHEISHRVIRELKLENLFSELVISVRDAFDYYGVMLLLLDESKKSLMIQAISGGYADTFDSYTRIPYGKGMIGHAAKTGQIQLSGNTLTNKHFILLSNEKTRSELSIPIKRGKNVIAVLDLQSDEYNAFDESDVMVMETLADQIAAAIQNARLYRTVKQELAERKRANEINYTLFSISNAVNTTFNLDELYRSIHKSLGRIIDVTNFHISLYDKEKDSLKFVYIVDTVDNITAFKEITNISDQDSPYRTTEVIRNGRPVLHTKKDFLKYLKKRKKKPLFTVSEIWLGVPLKIKDEVIGAMAVHSFTDPNMFDQKDVDILVSVSDQIALAIERKRTEEEKEKIEKQLQHAHKMESIGTLAGGVAHDFNNILGIILGNTELAIGDIVESNPARYYLDEIKTASLRAKDVVRQLLSFSRKNDPMKKPLKIVPIIIESLKFLRASIPASIEIIHAFPESSVTILADPTQLHQVMINLCTNAFHAMQEKGGTLKVGICEAHLNKKQAAEYPDLNHGHYAKLTIQDTGVGIPKHIITRIFDPYFTTKAIGKGTGMGLAVVHGIVSNHGGAIFANSVMGKGTTFTIFFPVTKPQLLKEVPESTLPTGNEKVLMVDDENALLVTGKQILERLGYKVEGCVNPLEALSLFRSKPRYFDIVVTDMTMPHLNGESLIKEIFRVRPDIPIILCTGYSEKITKEKAFEIGACGYLEKPLKKETLAMAVRNALDL